MPPSRLRPLPTFEPAHLTDLLEHDPTLLEEGLRVLARDLPFPAIAPGTTLALLAADREGRVTAVSVASELTAQELDEALQIRSWIDGNIRTLQAIAPSLEGCSGPARLLLLAGDIVSAPRRLLPILAEPRPEVYQVDLFESPSGPAICLRPALGQVAPAPGAPISRGAGGRHALDMPPAEREGDPLVGIPLSTEEAAEFRRLASPHEVRSPAAELRGRPDQDGRTMTVEN